jgi:hypothetical protein
MLVAGGVAWSLLGPADLGPRSFAPELTPPREAQPVDAIGLPPAGAPVVAPAAVPAPAPVEPTPVMPTPAPVVPRPAAPAAVQALTDDPCPPRLAAKSEAQASSDVRFRVTKPEPKQPPKTADLAAPDPGCAVDTGSRLVVNPAAESTAGANPSPDRGPLRADRPRPVGRSERGPDAAAASAPAARSVAPAMRPGAVQPSR